MGKLMEINEKIHIEEHNPEWVRQYEYEKEQLCNVLGDTVLGIEHIGSNIYSRNLGKTDS